MENAVISKAIILFNILLKKFNIAQRIGELDFKDVTRIIELLEKEQNQCVKR